MFERLKESPSIWARRALLLYCFSAPLSIALAQIAVIAFLGLWILENRREGTPFITRAFRLFSGRGESSSDTRSGFASEHQLGSSPVLRLALPIIAWLLICYLSTLFGVNIRQAIPECVKSSLYVLFPFAVYDHIRRARSATEQLGEYIVPFLLALIAGGSIATLHTIISAIVGVEIRPRVPGPVTESGQLALLLPLFITLVVVGIGESGKRRILAKKLGIGVAFVLTAVITVWPQILSVGATPAVRIVFGGLSSLFAVMLLKDARKEWSRRYESGTLMPEHYFPLFLFGCAVLGSAFLINLKRGPWFAVFLSVVILGLLRSRKLALGAVIAAAVLLIGVEPVRTRAQNFAADFSIRGGRQSMWELGIELVERYPLGLGPANSGFMRVIDPSLPPSHRHMHNNALNVAVESGLLGVAVYLWWIAVALAIPFQTFRRKQHSANVGERYQALLSLGITLGLLSWQLAGLVEYNFGDGEIRLLAFFLMGIALTLAAERARE